MAKAVYSRVIGHSIGPSMLSLTQNTSVFKCFFFVLVYLFLVYLIFRKAQIQQRGRDLQQNPKIITTCMVQKTHSNNSG